MGLQSEAWLRLFLIKNYLHHRQRRSSEFNYVLIIFSSINYCLCNTLSAKDESPELASHPGKAIAGRIQASLQVGDGLDGVKSTVHHVGPGFYNRLAIKVIDPP